MVRCYYYLKEFKKNYHFYINLSIDIAFDIFVIVNEITITWFFSNDVNLIKREFDDDINYI
jgi:hypothetical protein